MAYLYQAEVAVLSLVPASGPPAGATNVSVVGVGLLAGSDCRFGDVAAVRVAWLSPFELVCTSPAQATGARGAVEVTSNGRDWTADGVRFEYEAAAVAVMPHSRACRDVLDARAAHADGPATQADCARGPRDQARQKHARNSKSNTCT